MLLLSRLNSAMPARPGHLGDSPHPSCLCCYRTRSIFDMSSPAVYTIAQLIADRHFGASTTTSETEGGDPLSTPERMSNLGDITNPTIIEHQWNGDPMDWKSWPTGRPGPYVPEARMQNIRSQFQVFNRERSEESRTKENVIHVAEFSSSGRGEFNLYRSFSK